MNGKLLAVVIAIMVIVNGVLITVAMRKRMNTPSTPAQIVQQPTIPKRIVKYELPTTGLENCFNYYNYGKTKVNLAPEKTEYTNGDSISLKGSIVNENTFPLVNVVLYAHVKRLNTTSYNENGHYLIDTFPLLENINLQAQETKPIEITVPIKQPYPQGEYQLQYFVFSKYGFHYGGRPFFEEDHAGSTNLTLKTNTTPSVYFDITNIQVDGRVRAIRGVTDEFLIRSIPFDISIIDTRTAKQAIPVTVKFYNFEDARESNLVQEYSLRLDNTNQPLHIDFIPPEKGAYVMVAETETPVKTMVKYRFGAVSGREPQLRINDVGVSSFPATAEGRAWVCFHSPANGPTEKTKVTLSLLNDKKESVAENSINYPLPQDVLAISVPLEKLTSVDNFSLKATVEHDTNPSQRQEFQIDYTCDMFTTSVDDFTVIHTKQNPDQLIIKATDSCGKEVQTGKINNIRIVRGSVVQKEETNITTLPYTFSLQGLEAGSYLAQVKMGERIKEIPVEVLSEESSEGGSIKKFSILYIAVGLIITMITISVIIFLKRNKKS